MTDTLDSCGEMEDPLAQERARFDRAREKLRDFMTEELAHAPLRLFLTADDKHVPKGFLGRSVQEVLMQTTALEIFETPGVGPTRLRRLLDVIERALQRMETNRAARSALPQPVDGASAATVTLHSPAGAVQETSTADWQRFCDAIYLHRLDHLPIGVFAESLQDLPRALRTAPLSSALDAVQLAALGPLTRQKVEMVVIRLGRFLGAADPTVFASVPALPIIRQLSAWVERTVGRREPPTRTDLVTGLCEPLFSQIESDFSMDVSTMCALKLGVRSEPETLESIGGRFGVSRERIRQQLSTVSEGLGIRWPEGRLHLRRLLKLLDTPEAKHDARELAMRIADELFDTSQVSDAVMSESVVAAWRAAGRQRLTPMTAEQVKEWIARELPRIDPNSALELIQSRFPTCERGDAPVWFCDSDNDKVLRWLYSRGEPARVDDIIVDILATHAAANAQTSLEQLLANARDENMTRKIAGKVSRDPRFVQVDDQQWSPADTCGFFRNDGVWSIRLDALPHGHRPLESLPVSQIVTFLLNGMLNREIVDATAAGVHRFINELLGQLFAAALPSRVTPYVLADMLVVHGDGLIRHMRRRRLQWESAAPGLRSRGKRQWVGHVVAEAGGPMLLAELDTALRHYFQDYADYVINQLQYTMDDDDGESDNRVMFLTNLGHDIPVVVVPIGWRLQADHANVSPGVRNIALRLREQITAGKMSHSDLSAVPWLLELVQHRVESATFHRKESK